MPFETPQQQEAREKALATLDRAHAWRKLAEVTVELLQLYQRTPRGELRDALCATMNLLSETTTDIHAYLEEGTMPAGLKERIRTERRNSIAK